LTWAVYCDRCGIVSNEPGHGWARVEADAHREMHREQDGADYFVRALSLESGPTPARAALKRAA
jgi:hypothetical protein